MKIDLKRLYYGVTAFLIFLVAFFTAEILIDQTVHLVGVSNVPFSERYPMGGLPPFTMTPPATPEPVVLVGQPTPVPAPTLSPEQRQSLQQTEDNELRSTKEGVASSLAVVLVALPIWIFHWRRWRRLTETESAQPFRAYVYALMLITLMTAVGRGAGVVGAVVKSLFGTIDFSSGAASFTFAQDVTSGLLGSLLALVAWGYHRAAVRGEREKE